MASNVVAGCDLSESQKDFLQKVVEEYVPYDFITSRSYKYESYKKKDNIKLSNVELKWVLNGLDSKRIRTNKKLVARLVPKGAPEPEINLLDDDWKRWVPVDRTIDDLTLKDRQLENDIEVRKSPYRTIEKSVLTMMIPIKPFPLKQADAERWGMYPTNKPPVYSKSAKPTGRRHNSMMRVYYESK